MKRIIIILIIIFSESVYSQSLETYIQMALKNHPAIKSKKLNETIALEKINEAKTYPNTQVKLGIFALQPETRVGNQVLSTGISQQFPWFGSIRTEEKWLKEKAKLPKFDTELTQREIVYLIKENFYQMYELQRKIYILKENKSILKTYEDMAIGALENNKATMTDVLKIRAEKNTLHAKIYKTTNDLDAMQRNFNRLLGRDLNEMVNLPETLDVTKILVKEKGIINFPTLKKLKQEKLVYDAEKQKMRKKLFPKITLGVDYIPVNLRQDINIYNNGKDILMPKIGLSIPIFNSTYKSKIKQIEIKNEQIDYQYQNQNLNLHIQLEKIEAEFENVLISVMTAEKNIKEIQRAINISLKSFETAMFDFDIVLRLQLQKIKYQLLKIKKQKEAFELKARIDYLQEELN